MPTTVAVKVSLSREGARLPKGAVALEPLAAIAGGCRTRAGRLPPATSLKQGLPGRRTASLSLTPNFRNGHTHQHFYWEFAGYNVPKWDQTLPCTRVQTRPTHRRQPPANVVAWLRIGTHGSSFVGGLAAVAHWKRSKAELVDMITTAAPKSSKLVTPTFGLSAK